MPARGGRKIDDDITRKVAALFLDEGLSVGVLMERFGISRGSVRSAVYRVRKERRIGGAP